MQLLEFTRTTNAFNFVFEKVISAGDTVILKMPPVSANKRGVGDVGWMAESDAVSVYGTLSADPYKEDVMWQELLPNDLLNKTISAIKIENHGNEDYRVCVRTILN